MRVEISWGPSRWLVFRDVGPDQLALEVQDDYPVPLGEHPPFDKESGRRIKSSLCLRLDDVDGLEAALVLWHKESGRHPFGRLGKEALERAAAILARCVPPASGPRPDLLSHTDPYELEGV